MTEEEWLACTDPEPMLRRVRRRASERKLRLFACACCRLVWPLLSDPRSRRAVEVAERHADGKTTQNRLTGAENSAWKAVKIKETTPKSYAATIAWQASFHITDARPGTFLEHAAEALARPDADAILAGLIREVWGTPMRRLYVAGGWLRWNGGLVAKMAGAIYDERAFERLPILADALEEAGCGHADVLAHCRQGGGHARGCWVLDKLLGKK
jgi:hypothetical protein